MNSSIITIKNGKVFIPEKVSMRAFEIADLFGVYVQTVNANIKAIIKSGVVSPDTSGLVTSSGNIVVPFDFGLDMIVALAFRVQSHNAKVFREWLVRKATTSTTERAIVMIERRSRHSLN